MANKEGFTLIEFMIVVAIVVILALIAYPMYTKYVEEKVEPAYNKKTVETLKSLNKAEEAVMAAAGRYSSDFSELAAYKFVPLPEIIYSPINLGSDDNGPRWTIEARHESSGTGYSWDFTAKAPVEIAEKGLPGAGKIYSKDEINALAKTPPAETPPAERAAEPANAPPAERAAEPANAPPAGKAGEAPESAPAAHSAE